MKKAQKAGVIGISSMFLLAGALPAAAAVPAALNGASPAVTIAGPVAAGAQGSQVNTDTKIKRDEAVELAKKFVQIPEGYQVDNVSLQSFGIMNGIEPMWSINFSKREAGKYYGSVSVGIHGNTGKLLQFNSYRNDPDKTPSYPPKTSLSAAKLAGENFIKSLYPDELKETRYNTTMEENFKTPLNADVSYSFRYDRLVNGIPYPNNGISVEVDGDGNLTGFNISWDSATKFEDASGIISKEQALENWKKYSKLTASYFMPYDVANKGGGTYSVSYDLSPVQLDAKTGKAWNDPSPVITDGKTLTAAPLGSAPKAGQSLSKTQAVEAVAKAFSIPADAKLEDATYNEYAAGKGSKELQGTWNIRWSLPDQDSKDSGTAGSDLKMVPYPGKNSISASVDASTGEVRSYSFFNNKTYNSSAVEYKVKLEDAKSKAVDTVKNLLPHLTSQLVLEYTDPAAFPDMQRKSYPAYSFSFNRVIDGIAANGEALNLTVDGVTGEVTNYYNGLTGDAYPETKPALIDAAKAVALWQEQYSLELQYVLDWKAGIAQSGISAEKYAVMVAAGEIPPVAPSGDKTVKLAYVPVAKHQDWIGGAFLDAVSGEWKSSKTGEKATFGKVEAADLAGHWAERELNLMLEYNALDVKDGKVNPDQAATKGELIKMLVTAAGGGYLPMAYDSSRAASFNDVKASSSYFAYVENAVDMNLIDRDPLGNFNPDQIMTRDDMAQLIVRALGYNSLAERSNLFRLDVTDAGAIAHKGQAALVLGLGIMSAQDGQFRPQDEVSRAQAAVAFFRFLEQRGSLGRR